MIGLVLVTHGKLADELRSAMEHVVGRQRHVATVCIGPDDDIESRRAEIRDCIVDVDTGDGVVLLTDMFGGTPSNLAISQMDRPGVEVIAGVNLPMLVKLAKVRCDRPIADAVDCAQVAGRKYIASANALLPQCRAPTKAVADAVAALNESCAATTGKLNGAHG
jgi:PTS system mannose-specific IIA component